MEAGNEQSNQEIWIPTGNRVGWVRGKNLCLSPESAFGDGSSGSSGRFSPSGTSGASGTSSGEMGGAEDSEKRERVSL
jgi:hypothetical protein